MKYLSSLPEASRELVLAMRRLRFGRISFLLHKGTPVLRGDEFRVVRKIKLDATPEAEPATVDECTDYALKACVVRMLDEFRRNDRGRVVVEVRHGLPMQLDVEGC